MVVVSGGGSGHEPAHAEAGRPLAELAAAAAIEARYGLLLNNLGSVPPLEMAAITQEVLRTPLAARIEIFFGPAPLMTAPVTCGG